MRAGFDRLVSLNPPPFPPSSSPFSTFSSFSTSSSVAPSPSSPPGQRLLEALLLSPSRQLSVQAASALLNLDVTRLVESHRWGACCVLALFLLSRSLSPFPLVSYCRMLSHVNCHPSPFPPSPPLSVPSWPWTTACPIPPTYVFALLSPSAVHTSI